MKPTDFYKKEYIAGLTRTKKKALIGANANFLFYNGIYDMEYLNNETPPTDWEIANLQLLNIRYNFSLDPKLSSWINNNAQSLNNLGTSALNANFTLNDGLELIESIFNGYIPGKNIKTNTPQILNERITKNTKNLNDYHNALQDLKNLQSIMTKTNGFIQGNEYYQYALKVEKAIELLEADLKDANNGVFHHNGGKSYFQSDTTNYKKVSSIYGYGRRIKGRLFESHVNNFLSKLPAIVEVDNKNKTGVVDIAGAKTGVFDIFGGIKTGKGYSGTKEARTDTLLLDLSQNITIKCLINGESKNLTLSEFLDACKDSASNTDYKIVIPNEELDMLMNSSAFLGGIQSKSGYNQSPFNNFHVSPIEAIALTGLSNVHAKSLALMIDWYSHKHIVANHKAYNAWFNYCISHDLTRIIGKGNTLLAVRGEIIPTVEYFYNQWITYGKFIKAIKPVSLASWGTKDTDVNLSGAKVF